MTFGHVYTYWLLIFTLDWTTLTFVSPRVLMFFFQQQNNEALLHVHGVYLSFLVFNYKKYSKSVSYLHMLKLKKGIQC